MIRWLKLIGVAMLLAGIHFSAQIFGSASVSLDKPGSPYWKTIQTWFPPAVKVIPPQNVDSVYWLMDAQGQVVGALLSTQGFADQIRGYAGPTPLLIALDPQGTIRGICLLPNSESGIFMELCQQSGWLEKWTGLNWQQALKLKVDAVTGATLTSSAIVRTLQQRLAKLHHRLPPPPAKFSIRDWLIILLVLAALVLSWTRPKHKSAFRTLLLVVVIFYLGFYQGTFLSMALFAGWIKFGIPWPGPFGLYAMALLAVGLPLLFRRSFYCSYLCPYGAAQELLGRFSPWRQVIPYSLAARLAWLRWILLASIALLLLLNITIDLTYVEPFTFFLFRSASVFTLVLGALFLFLSLFFSRPWCRFFCPTGAGLDLGR